MSSDDPNDAHNYVSFEDFQRGAVGPWSEEGLRRAWAAAHPDTDGGSADFPQTAGAGAVTMWDTAQRSRYLETARTNSAEAVQRISRARAAGDVAEAEDIARRVSSARNELRTATQQRLSPGGRIMSEALEQPREFSQLAQRYRAQNAIDTYEEVARAAGRSRGSLQALTKVGKFAGPLGTAAGIGIGVYNVVEATPEERPRVIAEEGGGALGGAGGATLGMAGGTAAAGGTAVVLGLSGPPGWLVLGLGLLGAGVGGYYGSEGGRAAGGALYDASQSGASGGARQRYLRSPDGMMLDTQTGRTWLGPGPKY